MEMTEKMKAVLKEEMEKAGVELSEEELDEVTGGREMTEAERKRLEKEQECYAKIGSREGFSQCMKYLKYIARLPEGSPETLFSFFKDYDALIRDAMHNYKGD